MLYALKNNLFVVMIEALSTGAPVVFYPVRGSGSLWLWSCAEGTAMCWAPLAVYTPCVGKLLLSWAVANGQF